jgi:hypothetical protein
MVTRLPYKGFPCNLPLCLYYNKDPETVKTKTDNSHTKCAIFRPQYKTPIQDPPWKQISFLFMILMNALISLPALKD